MISPFQTINIFLTNLSVLLLTTSMVGGVMTVVWLIFGKLLEKVGFLNIAYDLLKMAAFFYCFPLAYVILKIFELELGRGYLFQPTKTILMFANIFLLIWILGIVVISAYVLHDAWKLKRKYKEVFICDIQIQELFRSMLHELKLDGKHTRIDIKQSYHVKIPCIVGIIHPVVIVPVTTYTQEELKYILMHEILHYKQKDILLKWVSIMICAFHFYNPFSWLLLVQIQKWSEYACDYKVCRYTRTVSKYFDVLISVSTDNGIKARLASHLMENKHELVERAKKMKNAYEKKKRSKKSAVIVLGIAFILSSMTVSAVTLESAEQYIQWSKETAVEADNEWIQYEEFTEQGDNENIKIVTGEVISLARTNNSIDWTVKNDHRVYSPVFECQTGDFVSLVVNIAPTNITVKIGIQDSQGNRRYINGYGNVNYVFPITYADDYYFYVENLSGTTVTVTGTYITP